ncbi:MAG: NAD(P)/FAD-dependent oxidoreductase [Prevotellaceae bacterium]|jgi:all-trans-retinol 13,14-reductase|nr:NAD(P)/FAD-dependent oxidoreductase [Prevotellaceae bacterium]
MKEKILIIGGGPGGLFTGALLAHEGCEVTVLEKNPVIGGGLQTFTRRGEVFETGMHILGGLRPGGSVYKICDYLGIMESLSLRNTDDDCFDSITYLSDRTTYRMPTGREAFTAYLTATFPHERAGIATYMDALYSLADEVDFFYLRRGKDYLFAHSDRFLWSADRLIAHYVTDHRLRDLLAYMNPMYGGVYGQTPAYIHALINVLYIEGACRFNGGSQQLADALASVITRAGGAVLGGKPVTRVEVENRAVSRVLTADGTAYRADRYISAVHPCILLNLTDGDAFTKAYRNRLNALPNAYSAFTVYIRFKPDTFPYINHTCYYQQEYGQVWGHAEYDAADWPRGFMYMTSPRRDQGNYAHTMIINCIMPFDCVRQWEHTTVGHRGGEYRAWKEAHIRKILDRMERLHPGFGRCIAERFASTPLTIRDYYGTKEGSLYGFSRDCRDIVRSQLSVATKVSNLLLTGQNINLHGICGVPLTAINTAEALLGENALIDKMNKQ